MRIPVVGPVAACVLASALVVSSAPAATSGYSVTDLGSLGFGVTKGLAINATGQVTGYSYSSKAFQVSCPPQQYGGQKKCLENPYHAFLWTAGTMTDLGTLGGHFSQGNSINRSGDVVGTADRTSKSGAYLGSDGFLWNGASMVDLGLFFPTWINDSREITGQCETTAGCVLNGTTCASGAACVLSNGTLRDLNALIPSGAPYQIQYATAINNAGQIVAQAYDTATNQTHTLLLTPS